VRFDDDVRIADAQAQRVGGARALQSSCVPDGDNAEPFMLSTAGCSDFDDVFAFRDNTPCEPFYGLFADGWSLNGSPPDDDSDCASTGNLDGKQGLLFVRERRSCRNIHERDPSAVTGPTVVDGSKGPVTVWCDMDVQGGGWTLLARSVADSDTPFGWVVNEGAVGDTSAPYSLDAVDAAVPAREMLIAEATDTMEPGPRQFLVAYPSQLNSPAFRLTDQQSVDAQSVGSACVGEELAGPFMMQRAGCIDVETHFYLRDNDQDVCSGFGLFSGGFNLAEVCCEVTECQRNGELLDRQGMIFTR
jgi:hypothetical protein